MPWSKLDDDFYDHPKTVTVGTLGAGLYALCLSYAGRQLTDGYVASGMIKRLIADVDDPIALAESLVRAGLFDKVEGGYQIHDYLEYNPSGAEVLRERSEARQRMAESRRRQTRSQAGQYQQPPTETQSDCSLEVSANNTGSCTVPVPVPVPVPNNIIAAAAPVGESEPEPELDPDTEHAIELMERVIEPSQPNVTHLIRLIGKFGLPDVEYALEDTFKHNGRTWAYVETILKRLARASPAQSISVTVDSRHLAYIDDTVGQGAMNNGT